MVFDDLVLLLLLRIGQDEELRKTTGVGEDARAAYGRADCWLRGGLSYAGLGNPQQAAAAAWGIRLAALLAPAWRRLRKQKPPPSKERLLPTPAPFSQRHGRESSMTETIHNRLGLRGVGWVGKSWAQKILARPRVTFLGRQSFSCS